MNERSPMITRIACLALLVAGAFCAGAWISTQPAARAGVRETTSREHFLAGSERSLPVLEDISETLKQIDDRLARIEKMFDTAARQQKNR